MVENKKVNKCILHDDWSKDKKIPQMCESCRQQPLTLQEEYFFNLAHR